MKQMDITFETIKTRIKSIVMIEFDGKVKYFHY